MKKYLFTVVGVLLATVVLVVAKGNRWPATTVESCHLATTNAGETVQLNGYLDSVYVDIAAGTTQTVTIATTNETIITLTAITADAVYRPRIAAANVVGGSLGVTNAQERFLLCSEKLRITVETTSLTTNDVSVTPTTSDN